MDWAGIEEVVYGETKHPEENLGPVNVGKNTLVRCFFNGAKAVTLYIYDDSAPKGKRLKDKIPMEMHDEAGYFAQLLPGKDRRDYSDSDFEFAKSLPKNPDAKETTLQVGHGAKKIKGYSAKNPATGEIVYADQNGRRFTKEAFENWEQFAKDGTFVH